MAHPGVQHSYETALAVQEAGLLHSYMTGLYFKPCPLLRIGDRLLKPLQPGLRGRRKEGLANDLVRLYPLAELSYLTAVRLRPLARYAAQMVRWRNRWFDKRVQRMVKRQRPTAIICYDTCAARTFETAGKLGVLRVLDQTIGHRRTLAKLMREEARLSPDFTDSLPIDLPEWFLAQCSNEAQMADIVIVGSEYAKSTMVRNGIESSRIAVVPYGADLARFTPVRNPGGKRFRILFVGQLSQRKGIKYLLEAVRQLTLPNLELTLVGGMVGTGSGLIPYQNCFKHVPNVSHAEVHRYFQNADLFVYPSLHEGSAIAIYEALASGLPVITTPNSGSVVQDGVEGFIVPIRDIEELKEKILLLFKNARLREQMGENARKRALHFSWASYRKRLGALLTQLVIQGRYHAPARPNDGSALSDPCSSISSDLGL